MSSINAEGKAVWIEKKVPGKEREYRRGVAIQFTQIAPDDVARIREFVDSVPPTE